LKISLSGFEVEDHLVSLALMWEGDGLAPNPLLSENLFRITARSMPWIRDMPPPDLTLVNEWLRPVVERMQKDILERNARYYVERRAVLDRFYGAKGDGEVLAELHHRIQEKVEQIAQVEQAIETAQTMVAKADLLKQKDKLDEELFDLQRRMQTEQMANFDTKRAELRKLEELRHLDHAVELVSVGQWKLQ